MPTVTVLPKLRPRRPRRSHLQVLLAAADRSKLLMHLAVIATTVAVVLGNGYWDRLPQSSYVSRDGAPAVGRPRLGQLPNSSDLASGSPLSGQYTLAPTSMLSGYVSQLSSAVVPEQLDIQIVTATEGQTVADIANQTGRSVETLLSANGMNDPSQAVPPGTQVRVPPVDGMLHVIFPNDTLQSIADRYQVDVSAITDYGPNNVQSDADLVPNRMIMIPGGTMPTRDEFVMYTVREGDTLSSIAQMFGLRPSTIAWGNSLADGNLIFPGQNLAIPPKDGVVVTFQEGNTIEGLAQYYGVTPEDIRKEPLNGLGESGVPMPGQAIHIPGGAWPTPTPTPTPPPPPPPPPASEPRQDSGNRSSQPPPPPPPAPSGGGANGYFIWPTNGVITQHFGPTNFWMEPAYRGYAHFHQGLDIANSWYTDIYAADGGTVIFAGWSSVGYGYAVAIDHGNGLVTWYAHMAEQPPVWVGQQVSQGQYIGPMGSTGASTGSHVHFAVQQNGVWVDPLNYLQ